MKRVTLILLCVFGVLSSCKKTPNVNCHCDHKIDQQLYSSKDYSVFDCAECAALSRTYIMPDEEFSILTHDHIISCSCR